jgi:hypothetical protein
LPIFPWSFGLDIGIYLQQLMRQGRYGNVILLKGRGGLDAKLAPFGYKAEWREFFSGPPLFEAINVGAIDFGHSGETFERQTYDGRPLNTERVAEQQRIADAFYGLGLLPKPIVVSTVVRKAGL